jgi:hypothetical protein
MTTTDVQPSAVESLSGRIFSTGVGAAELCTAYLGIHLGLYRSLAGSPATSAALAERTGCDERYLREWLTAQAVAGLLTAAGPDPASAEFALAEGTYEVLVDETSPAYLGGWPTCSRRPGECGPCWPTPTGPARACRMPPTARTGSAPSPRSTGRPS